MPSALALCARSGGPARSLIDTLGTDVSIPGDTHEPSVHGHPEPPRSSRRACVFARLDGDQDQSRLHAHGLGSSAQLLTATPSRPALTPGPSRPYARRSSAWPSSARASLRSPRPRFGELRQGLDIVTRTPGGQVVRRRIHRLVLITTTEVQCSRAGAPVGAMTGSCRLNKDRTERVITMYCFIERSKTDLP